MLLFDASSSSSSSSSTTSSSIATTTAVAATTATSSSPSSSSSSLLLSAYTHAERRFISVFVVVQPLCSALVYTYLTFCILHEPTPTQKRMQGDVAAVVEEEEEATAEEGSSTSTRVRYHCELLYPALRVQLCVCLGSLLMAGLFFVCRRVRSKFQPPLLLSLFSTLSIVIWWDFTRILPSIMHKKCIFHLSQLISRNHFIPILILQVGWNFFLFLILFSKYFIDACI